MTFPELFAMGLCVPLHHGNCRCFWCGALCDDSRLTRVSGTFWDWDSVAYPRSKYQCAGCSECLDEKRTMTGYAKLQKTRNHSWLATDRPDVQSFTKAALHDLRDLCLHPPVNVTWGLVIAESGQKHIMFRAPVNRPGSEVVAVQLELRSIHYRPDDLLRSLSICAYIASVAGKMALSQPLSASYAFTLFRAGIDPQWIDEWNAVWNSPLWRLAAFLCPGKEGCLAYLEKDDAHRVSPTPGGASG